MSDSSDLTALTNDELVELLAVEADMPDELWVEVGLRLGVSGLVGIRPDAVAEAGTGDQAARLRRFIDLWAEQPEAPRH